MKTHYSRFDIRHQTMKCSKKPLGLYSAALMLTALAALMLLSGMTAFAQDAAYCFSSAPAAPETFLSLGFVFTTNETITVSALGYYDHEQAGFATTHVVGIFDDTGNLLVSTELATGDEETLDGMFRYREIDATTLLAGRTYT